ncbi:MAG: hypothetical protein JXR60_12285 [Bacteroidales bacterium]|nr:hypothetical protein [Bacteroidales bacterium]
MFDELFIQAVKGIINKEMNATITIGTVTSVNSNVCDVDRNNLPELVDVRLNAVQDELESSLTIVPKIGSYVLCGIIEGKEEEAFVISTSEIEKIIIQFKGGDEKFEFSQAGLSVVLKSGKFDIKNEQEDLKGIISDLIDTINQLTVTTGTGPSGTPINAPAFVQIKQRLANLFN